MSVTVAQLIANTREMMDAANSDRWTDPKILDRLAKDYPGVLVVAVDAQHDVADQARGDVVAMIRKFIEQI